MTANRQWARRRTACMLTAQVNFVMSSVGFLSAGPCLGLQLVLHSMITGNRNHRAKCTPPKCHHCKLQHHTYLDSN
jgi:hypothetical protein